MNITKGKINTPIKAVIYGPEGIGKSTLAGQWPDPLFMDFEGGTARLDVARVEPVTFGAAEQAVEELAKNHNGFKTLVLDTADWLEKMLIESICQSGNQKSIEGFGYGKGYTHLAEGWKGFLDRITRMQKANGMHVVFLAHAMMRKQELPNEAGSFDRWELKLLKQSPGVLKEWADLVLFLNYKTIVVDHDGKKKAEGGRRVMYTSHHACWDAKNRFGMAEELPMEFAKLSPIFSISPATVPVAPPPPKPSDKADNPDLMPVAPATVPASAPASAPAVDAAPVTDKDVRVLQLRELMKSGGVTLQELQAELARKGVVPVTTHPKEYNMETLNRIIGNWSKVLNNINLQKGK